ncbi:SIR2 family protein [Pseudomonas asiatica]|uniref:SIR2 family protein n=1 Tax=Pseudomonas asiatica TaxID=2219225 RepID=UPI0025A47B45|nr:SIR2 family protein [Pseudomonas asiatica]WJN52529.1 SIR2 family protein [Pseudomonas asiatica]
MTATAPDATAQIAFSMFENKGVYAVLVGSGVSRSAGIQTGWEITMELVKRWGIATGAGDQDDWLSWYVAQTSEQPNYSKLLERLAATQTERRAIIQGFLEPNEQEAEDGLKLPTRAHRAIANMVKTGHIRVIVTTNFDRLMENALRDVGIEPTVVSSADSFAGAEPLTHSTCYILKIHGDYKDARILNTDDELGDYPPAFNTLLDRIIDEFGLIVAGWSGEWDHALRAAFIRAPSRRYPTYWLARGRPSEHGHELITQRRATVVNGLDADTFFEDLSFKLETIQQSRLPNPAGIELTLAMAKRFLAKPEHRIQLDDLITAQTQRSLTQLTPLFTSPPQGDAPKDFTDRVVSYEATIEPLARLCAVLGRWGSGGEYPLVLDAIKELYAASQKEQSGWQHWVSLKSYPATLVIYAYGMGLVRAERLTELRKLFSTPLIARHEIPSTIGERFAPLYVEAGIGLFERWRMFEGQDSSTTPFCNRLAEVLAPRWAPDFAGLHDAGLLYERFEFLSFLFFCETRLISEESLIDIIQNRKIRTIAGGRISWHSETINRFAHEYATEEFKAPTLAAGFAFGSENYLSQMLEGLLGLARFRF